MAEIGSQPQPDASHPNPNVRHTNSGSLAEFQSKHPKFVLWIMWFLASTTGWILGMIVGVSMVIFVCAWPIIALVLWIVLRQKLSHAGAWTLAIAGIFFLIAQLSGNFNGAAAWATLGLIVGIMQ